MNNGEYLKHQFLLSMPTLEGEYFSQSLIYLCEHNQDGAMGIIVNKPSEIPITEVFEQLHLSTNTSILKQPLFQGGPVGEEHGFILHQDDKQHWTSSLQLSHQLMLTTSMDILEAIANDEGPQRFLLALGYAGWGPGQLEDELAQNLWLSSPANLDILFDTEPAQRLKAAALLLGFDINLLTAEAGHA